MFTMPKPYPKEFRDDVVQVALAREPRTCLVAGGGEADGTAARRGDI